jgi:uncharacterized protein (DUF58 family)
MASPQPHKLRYLDPETLQKIGPLELVAREVVEGLQVGMHRSPLKGFSTEFSHHRQYVPGDETRHLDWRVYARTERYYLKLFEAETNFTANLLLDASSSMHYSSHAVSKLEYVKFMAASMAYLCVRQRDSVGLAVFDNQLRSYIEPKTTMGVVRTIADELEKVQGLPRTNVAVFHVLDPYELKFPFDGSCKFIGLEEDGEVVTQPKRIRAAYLEELRKFVQQIRSACERAHVDYVLVDTSRPVDAVLSAYLIGRIRSVHVR